MKLKELLLQGVSFKEILKQFSINDTDFTVRDEEVILSQKRVPDCEIFKERIFIQAKSIDGPLINLFGTLYYNPENKLSVFELDFVEKPTINLNVN
jgi:hypothetical protein